MIGIASFDLLSILEFIHQVSELSPPRQNQAGHFNIVGAVVDKLLVPVYFDTDVNGAAL